jgi:Trk-type K+ transport system membrane component
MTQLILRFIFGGFIVSLFAALGDGLKPKSFAGLFGAAPSVALATLGLTIMSEGSLYAATEARSMIAGAVGFCLYALVCNWLMKREHIHATWATSTALVVWIVCGVGLWALVTLKKWVSRKSACTSANIRSSFGRETMA